MSTELKPRRCGSYFAGHEPHVIQVLHAAKDHDHRPQSGRLLAAHDDGTVVVEVAGATVILWNHEPDRLVAFAKANENDIEYLKRWSLLYIRSSQGCHTFSVSQGTDATACPTGPPPQDLLDQLEQRGGFLASAADLGDL